MNFDRKEKTILIVDDEDYMVQMLETTMDLKGYDVLATQDASEALEIYSKNAGKIDLVITDQKMPVMHGTDLAREIKIISPEVPVIIYTGYADEVEKNIAEELGLFIINKPIIKKLNEMVDNILGK